MLARQSVGTKQAHGFGQREADDIRIRAVDKSNKCFGTTLDRIAPGLSPAFAATHIRIDVVGVEPAEANAGLDNSCVYGLNRGGQCHRGDHQMTPAGKEREALAHVVVIRCFWKDATTKSDNRVGCEDKHAFAAAP